MLAIWSVLRRFSDAIVDAKVRRIQRELSWLGIKYTPSPPDAI